MTHDAVGGAWWQRIEPQDWILDSETGEPIGVMLHEELTLDDVRRRYPARKGWP